MTTTWRTVASQLAAAIADLAPPDVAVASSGSEVELRVDGDVVRLELDLDRVGPDRDLRSLPTEDVARSLYSVLSAVQDVSSRALGEMWPVGETGGFAEPMAEVDPAGIRFGYGRDEPLWQWSLSWS